jgi:hypothetical protein
MIEDARRGGNDQSRVDRDRPVTTVPDEREEWSPADSPVPSAPIVTRRGLLKASLGGLASAMLAPAVTRAQPGPEDLAVSPVKILVLGAGMAA